MDVDVVIKQKDPLGEESLKSVRYLGDQLGRLTVERAGMIGDLLSFSMNR